MGEIKYLDSHIYNSQLALAMQQDDPRFRNNSFRGSNSPEPEPSLKDIFGLIKKRYKLIGIIALSSALIGLVYCLIATKYFTATADIEIKGYAPILAGTSVDSLFGSDTRKLDYQKTTTAKLKRLVVADKALSDPALLKKVDKYLDSRKSWSLFNFLFSASSDDDDADDGPADSSYKLSPSLLNSYLGLLDVRVVHETSIVEISATTSSSKLSQLIANAHAQAFIEQLRDERQDSVKVNLKALQVQSEDLKRKLEGTEQELANYAQKNKLVAVSNAEDANVPVKQIISLTDLLTQATARRVKSESLLREFEAQQGNADSADVDEGAQRTLRDALQQAEAEYASLRQNVTDEFPQVKELKARMTSLRKSLSGSNKRQLENLRVLYKSDSASEKKLIEQIDIAKAQAHETSKRLVQYNMLLKESASIRNLYETVLRQVQETQISGANESSNIIISDYAPKPSKPSAPLTKLVLVTSLLIGLLAGIITVVILEALNNRLRTPEDVNASLNLPILGYIPSFSNGHPDAHLTLKEKIIRRLPAQIKSRLKIKETILPPAPSLQLPQDISPQVASDNKALITLSSPRALVSEALRTIRASILLSSADQPPKVIMITSSEKGEGKTTVTANLAVAFAQAGHKTLIVDADLRQSKLSDLFNVSKESPGLSDYLAGLKENKDIVSPTDIPNAFVCISGSVPPNPAELLGSEKMKDLINSFKESYDFILVDCPPILPVADSLMMSRVADAVVFVTRSNKTDRGASQEARRRLRNVNAKILGVVLNDLDFSITDNGVGSLTSHHYYSNYDTGYAGAI